MTTPTPAGGPSTGRPGNRALAAGTALLVAAISTYAAVHHFAAPSRVRVCTSFPTADSTQPQVLLKVVGSDTLFVLDSAELARMDATSRAKLDTGLTVAWPCDLPEAPDTVPVGTP